MPGVGGRRQLLARGALEEAWFGLFKGRLVPATLVIVIGFGFGCSSSFYIIMPLYLCTSTYILFIILLMTIYQNLS